MGLLTFRIGECDRSHEAVRRLPLLSARPSVASPAAEHHRLTYSDQIWHDNATRGREVFGSQPKAVNNDQFLEPAPHMLTLFDIELANLERGRFVRVHHSTVPPTTEPDLGRTGSRKFVGLVLKKNLLLCNFPTSLSVHRFGVIGR